MRQEAAIRYRLSVVSPLERRLREWGLAYGVRVQPDEPEPAAETVMHRVSVDRSREMQVSARTAYARSKARLKRIRETVGEKCRVPSWAGGDAVRCTETRSRGPDWSPPLECQEVEASVLALWKMDPRAALALRARYCLLGRRPLNERIDWCTARGAEKLTRTGFRSAEARGRIWVAGALKLGC